MPISQFAKPSACLEPFIRFFIQRDIRIVGNTVVHPVPARPAPMIVFDFSDPTNILYYAKKSISRSPFAVVVGPQTYRRLEMQLHGSLDTFVIGFEPDGLFYLFGIPTNELTNCDFEAHSVLGSAITRLAERLGNSIDFSQRVRIVEQALMPRALRCSGIDGISAAVRVISVARGPTRIPVLASNSGISVRQFERRFLQQVGMRPKLFARIARFEAALEHTARFCLKAWSEVAQDFGYYDQMHMVHDFAEFTGGTPSETLNQLETVYVEQVRSLRAKKPASAADDPLRLVF